MTDADRIETYKGYLRRIYAADIEGLRDLVNTLGAAASAPVVVTATGFEGEQSSGQLVLEPMAQLNAALAVLDELDPPTTPTTATGARYADFSSMYSTT